MKKLFKRLLYLILFLFILLNVVVIFHAYKFTHFYEPGEAAIKKQEQKSKWDISKEILFGQNFAKQQNLKADSSFNTFYLTTKSGIKLEGWYFPVQNAKGTIAMFHFHFFIKTGMMEASREFNDLGNEYCALGFFPWSGHNFKICTRSSTKAFEAYSGNALWITESSGKRPH